MMVRACSSRRIPVQCLFPIRAKKEDLPEQIDKSGPDEDVKVGPGSMAERGFSLNPIKVPKKKRELSLPLLGH